MKGNNWKSRALQGAGIGIIIWWLMETFKQIGKMIIEINGH
jgi:hypothetical protein